MNIFKITFLLTVLTVLTISSCSTFHKVKYEYGTAVLEFILIENGSEGNQQVVMQVTDYKISKMYGDNFQNGVQIILNDSDAAAFADVTSLNVGKLLSIRTNDLILVTAKIMEKIPAGKVMISFPDRMETDRVYDILRG